MSAASHTSDFAYYASIEGNRSDLGLQTPVSQVIHDQSLGYGAFTNLQYTPNAQDEVSFVGQVRQDDYQIPDCTSPLDDDPQCVGQFGDVQGEADNFALPVLGAHLHEQRGAHELAHVSLRAGGL